MGLNTIDGKIRIKRSTVSGEIPTLGPSNDYTDGTWSADTMIYNGEFFFNSSDEKLWIGNATGTTEIILSGATAGSGGTDTNFYTTGTTIAGTTLFFDRTDLLSAYTADLSSIVGSSVAVQGGTNIFTGGTQLVPIVNLEDDITLGSVSATTLSGGTIYSGSTDIETLFAPIGASSANDFTTASTINGTTAFFDRSDLLSAYTLDLSSFALSGATGDGSFTDNGTNTYTGGTSLFQSINMSAATLDTLTVSGNTDLANVSATTLTILNSGATGVIMGDQSDNRINVGVRNSSILAGSANTISDNLGNVSIAGVGITASTSDTSYFSNTDVIGGAILSGGTDLYNIFVTTSGANDITRVQGGINISTGGTANVPIMNLDDDIALGSVSANTVSGGTIYSGSTDIETLFAPIGATSANDFTTGTTINTSISTIFFDRTDGLSAYTVDISSFSGTSSDLLSASTGVNSIIANNGTGNIAEGLNDLVLGASSMVATGADNSAVLCGEFNTAFTSHSVVVGGQFNSCASSDTHIFVGGGELNTASTGHASVVGGNLNLAGNNFAFVGGGLQNRGIGFISGVLGGSGNTASGQFSSVLGGKSNNAIAIYSSVAGGSGLTNSVDESLLVPHLIVNKDFSGGTGGAIYSGGTDLYDIFGSGGSNDFTTGGTFNETISTIFFDRNDSLSAYSIDITTDPANDLLSASTGTDSVIANNNSGNISSGDYAFTAGFGNTASGNFSSVFGGDTNESSGINSGIFGGTNNTASGNNSVILGGDNNLSTGATSAILGGNLNISSGQRSGILGGKQNRTLGVNTAVVGGSGNTLESSAFNSAILGGEDITGTAANTAYVPKLNIGTISGGTSLSILGIDGLGNVLTSTTAMDLSFAVSDEETPITTGTEKLTIYAPYAFTLTEVKASISSSGSTSSVFDVNVNDATILSTNITIDANEFKSVDAGTPPVISSATVAVDDKISIDIDTAGTLAAGAKIYLIGTRD